VKVIAPSGLLREAADALGPVWQEVVVIGAAALQIVLADDLSANAAPVGLIEFVVSPTRDVDVAVEMPAAEAVVSQLEHAGLEPSDEPYERGFTWVRGDLKVQLVRPFHPFPSTTAERLPTNPQLSLLARLQHRLTVAFEEAPIEPRLQSANAAALVALKQVAFGRTRPDGTAVARDYHDVYAVVAARSDDLELAYRAADYHVRSLVDRALANLAVQGGPQSRAAAEQHAAITGDLNIATHERAIVRASTLMARRLQ